MQANPYTPSKTSKELPGRERQLTDISVRLENIRIGAELDPRFQIFIGPRGVGKTSLLRSAQTMAKAKKFKTVWVTAAANQTLTASLVQSCTELFKTRLEFLQEIFDSATIKLPGLELDVKNPHSAASAKHTNNLLILERVLRKTATSLRQKGASGLIIFIDELQLADTQSLTDLANAWQHLQANPAGLPLAIFTAGLNDTRKALSKAATFTERFAYSPLTNLDEKSSERALAGPAQELNVTWHPDALKIATELTAGYPYFLQLIGYHAWIEANHPNPHTEIDCETILRAKTAFVLDRDGFFDGRLSQTTKKELKFLQAMAQIPSPSKPRKMIAEKLQSSSRALSVTRDSLIKKGLVEQSLHGELRFTTPGFGEYIKDYYDL